MAKNASEIKKILAYAEKHGASKAALKFGVSAPSVYNWRKKAAEVAADGTQEAVEEIEHQTKRQQQKPVVVEPSVNLASDIIKARRLSKQLTVLLNKISALGQLETA